MHRRLLALLSAGLLLAAGRLPAKPPERPQDRSQNIAMPSTSRVLDTTVTKRLTLRYLLYIPEGYSPTGNRWPLVLFLHGSGERGSDLSLLARQGLPKLAAEHDLPFLLAAPQLPEGEVWSADTLKALLDELEATLRVDPDRIYLTGLSMGAFGAWDLAIAQPDRFAALVAISGGGNPVEVCRLKNVPVWIAHGRKDDVIPVAWAESLAQRLERCGGKVRLTVYPDAGHDAWTRTYADPAFLDWLLAQRRPPH